MAAGTFVQGASVELTADAPIREPYAAYLQGALTYEHAKLGILYALNDMKINIWFDLMDDHYFLNLMALDARLRLSSDIAA